MCGRSSWLPISNPTVVADSAVRGFEPMRDSSLTRLLLIEENPVTRICHQFLGGQIMKVIAAFSVAAALLALALPVPAGAQDRTIKVIYPFSAGNAGDAIARIVAERISNAMSMPAIVENRTGAAGRIGGKAVANADPDGSTLLFASSPMMVIYPHSYTALEYSPERDFAPISLVATFDVTLSVSPQLSAKSLGDLTSWVKANPAKASYGSPGAGGLGHFVAVMYADSAKLEMRHVSYRGSAAVITDLVAGQIPFAALPMSDVVELHKAGKIRALATSGTQRSTVLPDVPTFREAGTDIVGQGWFALYAPAKTPSDLIGRLNKAVVEAMTNAEIKERLQKLSMEAKPSTPAELAAFQRNETLRWGPVVKASGFKPEQ
jgi:tripartite-type tricarboxylate transporter receptor subunit TctC